jgi:hypothetical protein
LCLCDGMHSLSGPIVLGKPKLPHVAHGSSHFPPPPTGRSMRSATQLRSRTTKVLVSPIPPNVTMLLYWLRSLGFAIRVGRGGIEHGRALLSSRHDPSMALPTTDGDCWLVWELTGPRIPSVALFGQPLLFPGWPFIAVALSVSQFKSRDEP